MLLVVILLIMFIFLEFLIILSLRKKNTTLINSFINKENFLLNLIPKPIIIISINQKIKALNSSFEKTFNVKKDELIDKYFYMIKNGVLNKIFIEIYKDLENVKKIGLSASLKDSSTITIRNENFKTKIYKIDKSLYFDEFGKIDGLICIIDDITEQEKEISDLMKKAIYDELTQTYNRRYFKTVIKNEIEKVKRYNINSCLLLFDIDFFKKINDTYGHDTGDLVLKKLSSIIKSSIRATDHLFRIGGEEFAIILTNTKINDATQVAEKIRVITENYTFEKVGKVTISIGVTKIKSKDTEETLYKRADEALYQSKKTGRNKATVFK
ncbi:diguanylate cyclase [Deferribacter thermophilus]|uniref:GGDEF domain-containing protein n=1 Tax=Deferribacter thermophilus TaxID=53573 RepID=UPI003C16C752